MVGSIVERDVTPPGQIRACTHKIANLARSRQSRDMLIMARSSSPLARNSDRPQNCAQQVTSGYGAIVRSGSISHFFFRSAPLKVLTMATMSPSWVS
jgi:hypothetical protein